MDNLFDYTISNPPYQEMNTKHGNKINTINIFDKFYIRTLPFTGHSTMIMPGGRWMNYGSRSVSMARTMIPTMDFIEWRSNQYEGIFPMVFLADGVSIVSGQINNDNSYIELNNEWFVAHKDKPIPLTTLGVKLVNILESKLGSDYTSVNTARKLSSLFFIRGSVAAKQPDRVFQGDEQDVPFDNYVSGYIGNATPGSAKRVEHYWIDASVVEWNEKRREVYNSWKVVASAGQVRISPETTQFRLIPAQCMVDMSTQILGHFETKQEAENYKTYLDTPLARQLFYITKGGSKKQLGYYIPDLGDYTDANPLFTFDDTLNQQLCDYFDIPQDIRDELLTF